MGKGSDRERELVNEIDSWPGCQAIRLAASGGGSTMDLPDILGRFNGRLIAGEMKYTSTGKAEIRRKEIQALARFAAAWEAEPVAIVRFAYDTSYYVLPFGSAAFAESLSDRARNLLMKEEDKGDWQTLEAFVGVSESALDF